MFNLFEISQSSWILVGINLPPGLLGLMDLGVAQDIGNFVQAVPCLFFGLGDFSLKLGDIANMIF